MSHHHAVPHIGGTEADARLPYLAVGQATFTKLPGA